MVALMKNVKDTTRSMISKLGLKGMPAEFILLALLKEVEGCRHFQIFFPRPMNLFRMHVPPVFVDEGKDSQIFYGNDSFYILFQRHQYLYERIQSAKSSVEEKCKGSTHSFSRIVDALCSLLNGSSDNVKFEDVCEAMMGNQSYVLLTVENLVHKLVEQIRFT